MGVGDFVGSNLTDKDSMKSDLSPAKGDVSAYKFFLKEKIKRIRITRIRAWTRQINDSFVLGAPDKAILGTSKLGDRRSEKVEQFDVNTNI